MINSSKQHHNLLDKRSYDQVFNNNITINKPLGNEIMSYIELINSSTDDMEQDINTELKLIMENINFTDQDDFIELLPMKTAYNL